MFFDDRIVFLYSDNSKYENDEKYFYNPEEYPAIISIRNNFHDIKEEIIDYIDGRVNVDASNPNAPGSNYPNSWKHVYFMNYMWEHSKTRKLFPKTYNLLKQYPEITLAGIASLEPHGKLMPHVGETNAIIRCHLGLKIPGSLPDCGLRVGNEYRSWNEGGVVCFNDAFNHEAWNLTNDRRFIMIFDIIRPEFKIYKKFVCAYSLGIATVRFLTEKLKIDKTIPLWLRKAVIIPFALGWWFYLTVQHIWIRS